MNLRSNVRVNATLVVFAVATCLPGSIPARGQAPAGGPSAGQSTPAADSRVPGAQAGATRKAGPRRGKRNPGGTPSSGASKPQAPAASTVDKTAAAGQPAAAPKPPVAELALSPGQIRFPAVPATSRSGPRIVTVTNRSGAAVTVYAAVSGDFALDAPSFPQTRNPSASMAVAVSSTPRQNGATSGVLTIWTVSNRTPQRVALSGATPCFWYSDLCIAFLLCPLYWFAMVLVRWHRVARTTRELLRAQINSMVNEVNRPAADPACAARIPGLIGLLGNAQALLDLPPRQWGHRLANVLFWSRGQEITGWGYVHEVEVQRIPCLDDETVTAKLETVERKLRAADDTPCVALANAIHEALSTTPPAALPRRRALLAEALAADYSREDNQYADLVSWQNKTSWLVTCGLILILALTGAYPGHSILLLIGATGGLLSRLSRSLDRKFLPTDYGASWTTLFLSPVAGALAAWTGILIVDLATRASILGSIFSAEWQQPNDTKTLALALLFGFSERLLDTVLDKLQGKALGAQAPPKPQAPPPPPPPPQAAQAAVALPQVVPPQPAQAAVAPQQVAAPQAAPPVTVAIAAIPPGQATPARQIVTITVG